MSNVQVPNLPAVATVGSADLVSGVQAGVSAKFSMSQIAAYVVSVYPYPFPENPLMPVHGGTGLSVYAVGDLIYASATDTLSKLADVATGNVLISGGVGVAPGWGKVDLTAAVSGVLPVANGGSGAATFTTHGVLLGNGTSAFGVTAVGATGTVLVGNTGADPTWATVSSTLVSSLSFGTTGLTPNSATTGAITVAGTLVAANGGTGFAAYAVGDILYADTTTTLAKLADVATGNVLLSGGLATAPAWGKVSLTAAVSGILPVANGGSGAGTFTAHGVLLGNTTSAFAVTGAGTTGTVLRGQTGADPVFGQVVLTTDVTGTLPSVNGGTGIASYAVGDILYADSTTTLAKLADVATGSVLVSGGIGTAPAWATVASKAVSSISFGTTGLTPNSATQGAVVVAGTLAATNGGTGVANASGSTITLGGALTFSGAFTTTFTVGATTAVTLPASGTLATLAGSEVLTNKTITTFGGAFTFNPANSSFTLSPTGSGTGTIAPATAGTINNMVIGGSTPLAGTFTTVSDSVGNVRSIIHSGSDKTTGYTLVTTDNGQYVSLGASGAITIPNSTFADGNVVTVFNNTSSGATITCNTTTAYAAGIDTNKGGGGTLTLATRGVCTILFLGAASCVISGNVS